MTDEFKNIKGTVESVGQKETEYGTKYSVVIQGRTYSFFSTVKGGGNSQAFDTFNELGVKSGSEVGLVYVEKQNPKGKYPFRNATRFIDPNDITMLPQNQPKQQTELPIEKTNDEVVRGQIRMHVVLKMMDKGYTLDQIAKDCPQYVEYVLTGKKEDEVKVEDIPF